MADKKITQLPSLSFISGSTTGYYAGEVVLPIVHNSTTVKMEAQKFALYATQWSATTASNIFIGNQTINGNVVVTGKLTAQEVHTEITSASIIFESGSTIFGNTADDTHTFTGTININGNVVGNAPLDFTSQSLNIATGSYNRLYDVTSSVHFTTASLNTQTGSQQLINVQNSTVTSSLNLATASLNFTTGALNIASGSYNRLYQVTSSVHSTTASLNQATSSLNFASGALNIATGSYNRFYDMTSSVHFTTQSLNVQTGSQESINVRISSTTGSINTTTSSFDSVFLGISSVTGAINTQSSSQDLVNFRNSTFTSSLNFATASLNSFTGSIISQTNTIATFTSSVNFATSSLNTQTGSQDLVNRGISSVTGSMNTQSSSQDLVNYQNSIVTSSFRNEIGGIEAYTASLKSAIVVNGSNVRIIGELTASRIYTEFITSSVLFVTGSNRIGDQSTDKHEFTGSVNINDTLFIKGQAIGLGELNAFTGSQINKDFTLSKVTASIDAHILKQSIQTGSQDLVNLGISTYTGSQNVINTSVDSHILKQSIQTGSQDLVNLGISTFTGSQNVINTSVDSHILKQAIQTGSQDLVNLGISTATGSLVGITNELMALTASMKAAAIVSSSQQIRDYIVFVNNSVTSSMSVNLATNASNIALLRDNTDTTLYPVFSANMAGDTYSTLRGHTSGTLYYNGLTQQLIVSGGGLVVTGSSNTTGSINLIGRQTITGSLNVTGSITIASGSITMPNRPAFRIIGTGGEVLAPYVLSGSKVSVDYNQGNHFNTTNGLFTAPIAGLYQVNVVIRTNSNTNSTINQLIVMKSGSLTSGNVSQIMVEYGVNTTMNHSGGSTISYLDVGDTLKAVVAVGTCSFDSNDNFSVAYIG